MQPALFSIIIPAYNVRGYIGTTVDSILKQTFADFEVLIIDDGSTDGTSELLDSIAADDSRVRAFHQVNSGVSAARNLGLDNAKGEWILFVDGDDALRLDALDILATTIAHYPNADLIGYGFEKVEAINRGELNRVGHIDTGNSFETDCCKEVCFGALNHYMVWTETVKRDILGHIRFLPLKNGEDVLFCNAIAMKANCYVEVDTNLYQYLQRPQSARSNQWTDQRHREYAVMNNKIFDNIISSSKSVSRAWIKRWIGSLLLYTPEVWQLDKRTQTEYLKGHRKLLKKVRRLKDLPLYLKIWLYVATALPSKSYFKTVAMKPMAKYSNLTK